MSYKGFLIFSALVLLLIFVLENINQRFWLSDFKVYYSAAEALRNFNPVYNVPFGEDTGLYKYSPLVLIFFLPLSYLPYKVAAVIFYFVSSAAICYAFILAHKIIVRVSPTIESRNSAWVLGLAFFCVLNHLFRELHLGNVNMILVCMILKAFLCIYDDKNIQASVLCGLAVLFKPYFLLLGIPILLRKKYNVLVYGVLFVCILGVVFIFLFDWQRLLMFHRQWFLSISDHSVFLSSNHTMQALLYNHAGLGLAPTWLILAAAGIVLGSFYLKINRTVKASADLIFMHASFCILSVIPNLLITDTEHFLFSVPLIVWCIGQAFVLRKIWITIVLSATLLLYGANSPEFFGSDLSDKIEAMGILGIANILLIVLAIYLLWFQSKSKDNKETVLSGT